MILVSTLRKLVEDDAFVFVARIPAHSFTLLGTTVSAEASVELFAKKPSEKVSPINPTLKAVVTRERAREVAHLDPFFDSIYAVK